MPPNSHFRHSSTLLYHGASRGGVQFFLDQSETWTQFYHGLQSWAEAGAHEEKVSQAGPCRAVLLEHQSQLKRGHYRGVVGDALQLPPALLQLQVDVQDAPTQAAGFAGSQLENLAGYPPSQLLWYQHGGAVQRRFLGPRQAVFKQLSQLVAASVLRNVSSHMGLGQAAIPEIQLCKIIRFF